MILKGISASTGVITGQVVNLESADTVCDIPRVLVTKYFTPDILVNFRNILGIVTENGGGTCHAAILARTMSIPCVAGVSNVTKLLQTGQVVRIDAPLFLDVGIVEVIE